MKPIYEYMSGAALIFIGIGVGIATMMTALDASMIASSFAAAGLVVIGAVELLIFSSKYSIDVMVKAPKK